MGYTPTKLFRLQRQRKTPTIQELGELLATGMWEGLNDKQEWMREIQVEGLGDLLAVVVEKIFDPHAAVDAVAHDERRVQLAIVEQPGQAVARRTVVG